MIACRDRRGRFLVHRRPRSSPRFPGYYNWLVGGAVAAGESYEDAARRELAEELGVRAAPRFVGKFLCRGAIAPYWMGIHETVLDGPVTVDASEISRSEWLTPPSLRKALRQWPFVPDSIEAFGTYSRASSRGRGRSR
ncbi:NUDIX domain-containing protein [Nocardia cyriacigeorgica]|uniref:NUDIX domain-containing protein n=1 Tax=Nocardia cyriacigeorgica TaxID=135487 RepID=A0A5R8NPK0_9NOCA|nr:NUDIX domain-containing protein [Nocardia cyriacigeorgica]TLF77578.1 NUDIX domain-containing protein [Nocardia cyriacigeorgica]